MSAEDEQREGHNEERRTGLMQSKAVPHRISKPRDNRHHRSDNRRAETGAQTKDGAATLPVRGTTEEFFDCGM